MTISMPSYPNFTTCRFGLQTNSQTFASPLTNATQRMALGGSRWIATYSLPAMNRQQAAGWKAFFDQLQGMANTFYGFDPDCKTPRGAGTGTPLVDGALQSGTTLAIKGCTPNTNFLLKGDYFTVNGELKRTSIDVRADGSGNAGILFYPSLRSSPADNAPIGVTQCSCTMILSDDMQAMFTADKNGIYQPMTFSAFEVFS